MPGGPVVATRWPPVEITRIEQKLNELAALVETSLKTRDQEAIASWLARLLVVRSCGYVEQAVLTAAKTYVGHRSAGYVQSFATSAVPVSQNPTPGKLLEWVRRFDTALEVDLEEVLSNDDERLSRELSFLVDRRNKIAHGLNEGITGRKALELRPVAIEIADWFLLKFNPSGLPDARTGAG